MDMDSSDRNVCFSCLKTGGDWDSDIIADKVASLEREIALKTDYIKRLEDDTLLEGQDDE